MAHLYAISPTRAEDEQAAEVDRVQRRRLVRSSDFIYTFCHTSNTPQKHTRI